MPDPRALESLGRLLDVVARLRAPGGCPWDREQTWETLRPYLLEEAYEVLDAIAGGDPAALRDELGDLLLQIVLQAEIAGEGGHFTIADVAVTLVEKLVRRHPHVFGDVQVRDAAEVVRNWQRIKAEERRATGGDASGLDRLPAALPALARAQEAAEKAAHLGYDWPDVAAVLGKLREELAELEAAVAAGGGPAAGRELGDVLLTLASVARHLEVSAELALRDATARLVARLRRCAAAAGGRGVALAALDPAERERLWRLAKAADASAGD
ncbi:MAG TPA: nucleoside triphosphate pyrophosphohydrolase [Candidatus Binatia bacterium]|nr:nucleoside triphosphate pyrophosphohydrolase [Candidatus Binatia bacterium]